MPILAKEGSEIKTTMIHYILGLIRILRLVNMYFGTVILVPNYKSRSKDSFYYPNSLNIWYPKLFLNSLRVSKNIWAAE